MMDVVIVGNARCYHTMDKYRLTRSVIHPGRTVFLTDLIESESHARLVSESDEIAELFNVDRLLLKNQSMLGNVWRNAIKALAIPMQMVSLRRYSRRNPGAKYHAITMYYMVLCWVAGISFIGTPQGSEILQRPHRSRVYRFFAAKALRAAKAVIVDSVNMRNGVRQLSGVEAVIMKNGFDVAAISGSRIPAGTREAVVSIRGMHPLYRIDEILKARAASRAKPPIAFLYPLWEEGYKRQVVGMFHEGDSDLGRLPRSEMYRVLGSALLAISIPSSDSSPRSVYEAIFAGCSVAVTYSPWIDELPECMRRRLYVLDLGVAGWLDRALEFARQVTAEPYVPSDQALEMCDQGTTMRRFCERFYGTER